MRTGEQPASSASESAATVLQTAFQENAAALYRFIYAKIGNRQAAEDLTSVVFLKAVRWIAADRSADSVRAWLYATARTSIADYWRARAADDAVAREVAERLVFCGTDGEREARRTRERAERILAALPPREGEVLRLRFLRGYDARAIAAELGTTPGNVRVLQLRALRRAAAYIDPAAEREGEADG
jgi:RNA polymerase sigma-70 factor (ECF subfamily)